MSLTNTIDKTKTLNARWAQAHFTPEGAGATVVIFKGRTVSPDGKLTTTKLKWPDAEGVNRDVDEVAVEAEEMVTLADIAELDTCLTALGGLTGFKKGTVIFYIRDPRDATGKVRFATQSFACSMKRPDGEVKMGGNDFTLTSLVFTNLSGAKITWSPNADEPVA